MKANALKRYLKHPRAAIRARGVSVTHTSDVETFEVDVDVDLPQRPLHDIRKTERVQIRMPANDGTPQVYALRKSFPPLPHMMMTNKPYPRQLCLFERPWAEERANWSPRSFIERIRRWFSGSADGTLHPDDQPLEPVLQPGGVCLAFPAMPLAAGKLCRIERLFFIFRPPGYWVALRNRPPGLSDTLPPLPVLVVRGPTVNHGIMNRVPETLGELEDLLSGLGQSLVGTIAAEIGPIRDELLAQPTLPLFLVIELPKTRYAGKKVEDIEHRAFVIDRKLSELFGTETVHVKNDALYVPKKAERLVDKERLKSTKLTSASVRWLLTPAEAAEMNGHAVNLLKILALGVGALGSQLANNLSRGGFGDWTLVDDDIVDAHNPARHLLTSDAVGLPKVSAVARELAAIYPDRPAPREIPCNYLVPGTHDSELASALKDAELVLDLSASVTVERQLARDTRSNARRMSAFLNQRGDESVLLVEDKARKIRLFWLEALYYRAVSTEIALRGHFDDVGSVAHRYGNGCREVSTVVPQDGVALHAALLSQAIRRLAEGSAAAIAVHRWDRATNAVSVVPVPVLPPAVIPAADWEILVHPDVVCELRRLRAENLPRETGGILMGTIDRIGRMMAVTGLMPAPADSEAWPTSFIRGSNGLAGEVRRLGKRSLENVVYVGEWHSHPEGCDSRPSAVDVVAVGLSAKNMRADDLPTVMMIVADRDVSVVLQSTDSDELHCTMVTRIPASK